jgi:hypothetical protein
LAVSKSKIARLKEAGVITTNRLPAEYRKVLDGMRESDIDALILMKKRLDAAERKSGKRGKPLYECFVPL